MALAVQPESIALEADSEEIATSLREMVRERWEASDEISASTLVAEIREKHGTDLEFLTAFFDEYLYRAIDDMLETLAKHSRQAFVRTTSGFVSREKLEENTRTRLSHVFEANGTGSYRTFLALQKKDLLELNERDRKVIATRSQWVAFRRDLARQMTVKQTVADRFSTADLETAWRKAFA